MLIKRLTLKKILSFKETTFELGPLNVLIGANAVGKSNLIEAISLLQAAPTNIGDRFLRDGGVRQWLWLGERDPRPLAEIECELTLPRGHQFGPLIYRLQFSDGVLNERLARAHCASDADIYFDRSTFQVTFGPQSQTAPMGNNVSFLAQFKNPADTTPITEVGNQFAWIQIFREFRTGILAQARQGSSTAEPKAFLTDGADNLAPMLAQMRVLGVHDRFKGYLKRFCDRFDDVKVDVGEGLARTFLKERGLTEMLSGIRMSDGTLKFLCLLAVLFHPKPAPLICIEEPELGLHPDALRLVAEVLVEASERTQLIITTHSEALVDALTDHPESVLVCERDFDNGTQFKRLEQNELDEWLEHYTLGELWRNGEIGGGR